MWIDDVRRDARQALRSWRRNRAFTLVAILTLALGIGANSAIFSIVHAVLLRPLPYADADRLVRIVEQVPARESVTGQPERVASMAVDEFLEWRTRTTTLASMAMYAGASMTLTAQGPGIRLKGARVSAALLPMLGLRAAIGRTFEPGEERRGADAVVVLANGVWQRHFAGDPGILHRRVTLDGRELEVVGVMSAESDFPERDTEFWIPFVPLDPRAGQIQRAPMIARLKDGVSLDSATREANAIGAPMRPPPRRASARAAASTPVAGSATASTAASVSTVAPGATPPFAARPASAAPRPSASARASASAPAGTPASASTSSTSFVSSSASPSTSDPASDADGSRFEVVSVQEQLVAPVRPALMLLVLTVGAVLLIACANVANLLLARSVDRQPEMSTRRALGAGRGRLVRQLLTESLLLAAAGGAAGFALAFAGVRGIRMLAIVQGPRWLAAGNGSILPRAEDIGVDGAVLAFTLSIACLTGLLFGLAPIRHLDRVDRSARADSPSRILRILRVLRGIRAGFVRRAFTAPSAGAVPPVASAPRGRPGLRIRARGARPRGRDLLVIAQLALATVLLVCAGLLMRSFVKLSGVDAGYDPRHVLTFQAVLPPGHEDDPHRPTFASEVTHRLQTLPGVQAAGFTNFLPLTSARFTIAFNIPGVAPEAMTAGERPQTRYVSQDYLRAMGVRLIEGRWFGAQDEMSRANVLLVNQALARRFFRDRSPVGTFVTLNGAPWEIVGIVADVRQGSLETEADPQWFLDFRQLPASVPAFPLPGGVFFAIRADGDPLALASSIRGIVRQLDPGAALDSVYAMDRLVSGSLARPRFYAVLLGIFACVAGGLAAIGIYGLLAYSVTQRTREIGIRMALGAQRRQVLFLILRQAATLILVGVLLGLGGGVALTRYLAAMLYGLTPLDPPTFAIVALSFALIAAAASCVPARRAATIAPLAALRHD